MGNIFGSEKPLKEIVREHQRAIRKAIRELDKEINALTAAEKKLTKDIKEMAKKGQMGPARIMAKDFAKTRSGIAKFIEMKAHLNAVALKIQTIKSHDAMANAMKGVTKALVSMNKQTSLPGLQKIMKEFMKENERAEIMGEAIGDTIDDAMEDPSNAEEEEQILGSILTELGLENASHVPEAPGGAVGKEEAGEGKVREVNELEERLNNLKRT